MSSIHFNRRTLTVGLFSIVMLAGAATIAHADLVADVPYSAPAPTTLQALASSAATILNDGAILLITASVAVYFYSIAGDIFKISRGEASGDELKKTLFWGLLVIFAMVSIWGIIQILQYSLFGGPPPSATNGVINY
jgi:hypothetical protein